MRERGTWYALMTGNTAAETPMAGESGAQGGPLGCPYGVYIKLITATAVDVVIKDARGFTIFTITGVVASTYYPFGNAALAATSCSGVPTVTTANVTNSSTGTIKIWLDVR